MHKLRKPRAITQNPSQTLTNNVVTTSISTATRSGPSNTGTIISSRLDHQISSPKSSSTGFGYTTGASFHPRYAVEQYWAVRALTAETLLSSRTSHQQELRSLSFAEEMRRSKALSVLAMANEARHAKLEKFIVALFASLLCLVMFVIYLATDRSRQSYTQQHRWSLPSHFTIPILSPFATVVEHETSVIGSKSVATFLVVLAGLGYMIFRHWLARIHRR